MIVKWWGRDGHYNKIQCKSYVQRTNFMYFLNSEGKTFQNAQKDGDIVGILNLNNVYGVILEVEDD